MAGENGTTITTDLGHRRLTQAAGDGTAVVITHVSIGDGGGSRYDPAEAQTTLRRDRRRVAIKSRHYAGDRTWRVKAEFVADDTPVMEVREIGFWSDAGELIYLWAGASAQTMQAGAIDLILEQILVLDRQREGLTVIAGPEDEVFELALGTAIGLAQLQHRQMIIDAHIRRETGAYLGA